MKSLTKNLKLSRKSNESTKLIGSDTNQQQYGNGNRSRQASNSSASTSPTPTRRPMETGNNPAFDYPMVTIRPGQHPSLPSPTKVEAVMDMDFDKVPFQFYSVISESWKPAVLQAFVLLLICLVVPCLFMLFVICGNKIRMDHKPRMTQTERKKSMYSLVLLLLVTLTKDLIIIMIVLHVVFLTPVSAYLIGYSPVVFFWSLLLFAFPLTIFYFAEAKYVFGFDSDKKNLLKAFTVLVSNKAKQDECKKVDDQDKYFSEKYRDLSSIKTSKDEFTILIQLTSKTMFVIASLAAVLLCILHCLIPLFIQIMDCSLCGSFENYHVSNTTRQNLTANATLPTVVYKSVIGLSAVNSFTVSLFASVYFIYLTLWKFAMLSEWKRFNETESDTGTTLINGGPQGIAMWWKIRQTLKLFSTSNLCMTVIVEKFACLVTLIIITCLSLTLMYQTANMNSKFHVHAAIPLLFDNILLYAALVLIGVLSYLISQEKTQSSRIIELKQLNVGYELGRLMNLDQETVDSEPGVRIKIRVMRGCLMLLQELTSTMENLERNTSSRLVFVCLVLGTLLFLPSTFLTARFLLLRPV